MVREITQSPDTEPFVIDDSGILDAFSETAWSSNEDDSSVESAASTTANELATTTVAKTTTTQSDNYYDWFVFAIRNSYNLIIDTSIASNNSFVQNRQF